MGGCGGGVGVGIVEGAIDGFAGLLDGFLGAETGFGVDVDAEGEDGPIENGPGVRGEEGDDYARTSTDFECEGGGGAGWEMLLEERGFAGGREGVEEEVGVFGGLVDGGVEFGGEVGC